ncbi:MAG: substrate-binding domain-containing protein [Candidatus Nealsonbacteria bacterium]|nr:substrate-binding domain-containing protein [Candidatus Nealsonbacteria bacterium]
MRSRRFFFAWALAAGCTLLVAGGCGDGSKRIVLISNAEAPFWDAVRAGLKKAAEDLELDEAGLTATMEVTDGTTEGQIRLLKNLATQSNVAAVAVSCAEPGNPSLIEALKELRQQGVAVITVDSDVDREKFSDARVAFVGTDNLAAGKELGVAARNLQPDGGGFITFVGYTSSGNAIERVDGFTEGAGEKFKPLDNMGDRVDPIAMRKNVRTAIANHKDELTALVGIWSQNAPAAVDVLRKDGLREKYKVYSFDADPATIKAMGDGDVDAMVVQNPYRMGYDSIKLLKAIIDKDEKTQKEILPELGQPGGDVHNTGLKIVVPDGSPLGKEAFSEQTEFLELKEFREWLDELELTGS